MTSPIDRFRRRLAENVTLQLRATLAVAVLFALTMAAIGRFDTCGPGDRDGQCGMGRFVLALYGMAGGSFLLVVGVVAIALRAWRRRRGSQAGSTRSLTNR
ncbi:hypothetical protein J421_5308 (plasmid) [Gemmatirosa kalamazoonensis]|uniref:Transmembrane protein n=1 Tax=Gemmatirosa kalamazoonensis TaxID=861299 RepID=W0RTD2_9BACT|nr:hypothetical protein [Gemmatirosa kalamazoonensis]AHG92843.1 hypothetical protein J421_5308 [Gemmatirosa kalamazoonensis]